MTTTQQILDQLNTYEFDHTPETENIWQDVIADLDVDDEATAAADPSGASDRFVLTDGREFRWERSYERGRRWLDDSPAITAEIVDVNDIVVVDDREVSFDTVEVRRGDVKAELVLRGLTVAGAYVDEVTTLPEGFFMQLLGRMSVAGAKLFVLATIRVESSEDEAPYAAAVAEFGDVTWL